MKRIAVPLAIGLGAGTLLAAAYIALPYAGIHLSDTLIVAIAAALAFSASIAVLAQGEINRPKPKPKASEVLARPLDNSTTPMSRPSPSAAGPTACGCRSILRPMPKS